jgi:type IV pilus assembly protein PilB
VAARPGTKGEQVLVVIGPELPAPPRRTIGQRLAALFGRLNFFRKQPPPPERDPSLPRVALSATGPEAAARTEAAAEADGYELACDLVAAAVRERAGAIAFEAGPQGVAVRLDVDGVARPVPKLEPALPLDKAGVAAAVGVLKAVAGFDPKQRGPQADKVTATVESKPWACTVSGRRDTAGERLEVVIDHVRPKFKTLADIGMPETVIDRVQEFLKLESGLLVLAAPRGGGLSTLFDGVVTAADRLLRDFVVLEDAAAPRPEIQNLRPVRWDSRTGGTPAAALEAALREYANVITICDLEDADLAKRLVAQAGEGKLVIVGVRAADAAEGVARLTGWGVDPQEVGRVLLGVVGVRLVRKLCPKCRQEFFPAVAALGRLGLDPDVAVTLFRPARSGCSVCTGTGYLGRTAACELAAGPTLQAYVSKAADAGVLRKAALKDGMVSVLHDAIAKAARGVTSIEEVQRVFQQS